MGISYISTKGDSTPNQQRSDSDSGGRKVEVQRPISCGGRLGIGRPNEARSNKEIDKMEGWCYYFKLIMNFGFRFLRR